MTSSCYDSRDDRGPMFIVTVVCWENEGVKALLATNTTSQ